jgi:hypothetical protein
MNVLRVVSFVSLWSAVTFAAEPMHVLIFAGGVTEADGAAALSSFKKLEATIAQVVKLPAGEPKVVDSSTLPGLKPGFRVVTLGVCKTPGPALAALKAIYPGTYSKQLTGDVGPEKCPVLTGLVVAPIEPTVKVGASMLSAFVITEAGKDERGRETPSSTVGFVLVEKKTGLVRSVDTADGDSSGRSGEGPAGWEYEECTASVSAEKTGFLISRSCSDERTGCAQGESAIPKRWTETKRVSVKNDAVELAGAKKSVSAKNPCVAGASEGD